MRNERRGRRPPAASTSAAGVTIDTWLKLSAVAVALLYVCGWTYLRAYYDHFRIDIAQLDLTFNDILLHAALVIGSAPRIFSEYNVLATGLVSVSIVGFVALLAGQMFGWSWLVILHRIPAIVLLLLATVILLFGSFALARIAAFEQIKAERMRGSDAIVFSWRKECELPQELQALNGQERLRLLRSTKDRYFVFSRPTRPSMSASGASYHAFITTFQVPASCVIAARSDVAHPILKEGEKNDR